MRREDLIVKQEIRELRQQESKNILVGSPGLIVALTQLNLIDEYQLNVHRTVPGRGLRLFKNISDPVNLNLCKQHFVAVQYSFSYETVIK
jgi:dihydrofolate reductase